MSVTLRIWSLDLFAGPIFLRECATAPRQLNHFLVRGGYVAFLLVLTYTAVHVTFGFQAQLGTGDVARFGKFVFILLAFVQLSIVLATSLLLGSANVAQEKDRRTLILLLMTDLQDRDLVVGKLQAGLLTVLVMIGASLPVFCLLHMLGGFTLGQVLWLEALCLATAFAAASWGSLVAFWREKTFQTLAISVLGAVLFIGAVELIAVLVPALAEYALWLDPYRGLSHLLNPLADPAVSAPQITAAGPVVALGLLGGILTTVTTLRLRIWNPSKSIHAHAQGKSAAKERTRHRSVWDEAVIWREMRTRAYGRKIILIKLAYFVLAGFVVLSLRDAGAGSGLVLDMIPVEGFAFVVLSLVALLLVNAQAVTSLTSERDGQTLELLLATDVTAREFVFGKLGGVLYNTWQVIAVPLLLAVTFLVRGDLTGENAVYVILGFLALTLFSATLGLHSGLSYENSRAAIANSMGTIFFLFVGIFVCLLLIFEARSSYAFQLPQFLLFIVGGSLGLWLSLTHRNPSPALKAAAFLLPFCTFWALTEFLLQGSLGVCVVIVASYSFTTIAMLVPAVSEFDVALGRSTLDQG